MMIFKRMNVLSDSWNRKFSIISLALPLSHASSEKSSKLKLIYINIVFVWSLLVSFMLYYQRRRWCDFQFLHFITSSITFHILIARSSYQILCWFFLHHRCDISLSDVNRHTIVCAVRNINYAIKLNIYKKNRDMQFALWQGYAGCPR